MWSTERFLNNFNDRLNRWPIEQMRIATVWLTAGWLLYLMVSIFPAIFLGQVSIDSHEQVLQKLSNHEARIDVTAKQVEKIDERQQDVIRRLGKVESLTQYNSDAINTFSHMLYGCLSGIVVLILKEGMTLLGSYGKRNKEND